MDRRTLTDRELGASARPRALHDIAREIVASWQPIWFGAEPYVRAMLALGSVADAYGMDTGEEIVQRFLVNAKTWRGEDARRIKAELREML